MLTCGDGDDAAALFVMRRMCRTHRWQQPNTTAVTGDTWQAWRSALPPDGPNYVIVPLLMFDMCNEWNREIIAAHLLKQGFSPKVYRGAVTGSTSPSVAELNKVIDYMMNVMRTLPAPPPEPSWCELMCQGRNNPTRLAMEAQ